MSLGLEVTKTQVDGVAGTIARDINRLFEDIVTFNLWLDGKSVADLEAMGYSTNEANVLKSAYADAAQLQTIFTGAANLASVKDFRTFLRQLWGLGGLTANY